MTAWKDLPNAKYIDQVLAELVAHPDEFAAARDAGRGASGLAALSAAYDAAYDAARHAAWNAAYDAARSAAYDTARDAITALIAWDHSVNYLDMTYEELGVWYQLNEDPACVLLLPYARARELIAQKIRT